MSTPQTAARTHWLTWLPGLQLLKHYRLEWLRHDLMAGFVLTTMLVPAGIAYAEASGVPGVYGLYATIIPLLAYALFGPSRILVLGPDSSLAAPILAVLLPLSQGNPAHAVALAGTMAIVTGLTCILAGTLKLGFITELLSKPIRYGYLNGIALTVLLSQTPKLLGFTAKADGPILQLLEIIHAFTEHQVHTPSFLIGAGTLITILLLKPFPRLPGMLIAVTGATLITAWLGLDQHGVKILGALPQGLPALIWPAIPLAELKTVVIGGIAVALVSFADTSVLSRTYAAKTGQAVNPNQEMIGLGAANLAAGLFQGFPISSSSSRTPVAEAAGSRTQLTGVVGALCIALLLVFAPTLLQYLPNSALAAVVITAVLGLFEIGGLKRIYRLQPWEFWLSMACFAGVVVLGVIPGILLAIVLAVIEFLWDGWRPHYAILGRVDGMRGFHDIRRHPEARLIPGLVLFRWDAPLFFANAEYFHSKLLKAVANAPTPVKRVIVTAEPVTSIDITSADMLTELLSTLQQRNIELHFAEIKGPVKDKLHQFELFEHIGGRQALHPTVGAAVDDYLDDHQVNWEK